MRIVGGEEDDAAPVDRAEAGGRIGHPLPDDQGDDPRQEPDPEPACERSAVQARSQEAAADDHVCAIGGDRLQQAGQLARVVLPVAVDLDRHLEAMVARILVPRLNGAADADVVGKSRDQRSGALGLRLVPSVDPSSTTRISKPGSTARISSTTRATVSLLVQGRDDRNTTHGHDPIVVGGRKVLGDGPHRSEILRGPNLGLLSGL